MLTTSGTTALDMAALLCDIKPGDEVILSSFTFSSTATAFVLVGAKLVFVDIRPDTMNIDENLIEDAITPKTKAIYLETPTNPMMRVSDIEAIAKIAKKHRALFIVDNTFLSPYFQNPLKLGANIVVHSGTKFLAGHNDTLSGFIVVKSEMVAERLRYLIKTTGAGLAPFDSWLVLRGIKTLALRMEKAQENALKIAQWLKTQKCVKKVIYPGLAEHKGYEIMKKQARGFGSMITFDVESAEKAKSILNNVQLVLFAESLGGVESLITYPVTQTHADVPEEIRLKNGISDCTLRLSVGIENADDLIADLTQAFLA
jgi:cystathionine gamma-synthase